MAVESGVIAVTDDSGLLIEPRCFDPRPSGFRHRQLRPKMPEDYVYPQSSAQDVVARPSCQHVAQFVAHQGSPPPRW